jgi:membrane protease YdiL (CAAX protease family)
MPRPQRPWYRAHSLSLVIGSVLVVWLLLYLRADPSTHLGAFYGNSIADWLGSFVAVVATKFWYEKGSIESRLPPKWRGRGPRWLLEHSLTVVLLITWIGWIVWFARLDASGKTGQVVGNIVSEWGQAFSLVWFTKYLYERGSKESH